MASNFLNSEGTDLDDVFYVNNSNAGALGFLMYNGQDLGNRYPSGSLGYNVGYKNSAGTDIGYLRGKLVAPTVSADLSTPSWTFNQAWSQYYIPDMSYHDVYFYYNNGILTPTLVASNAPVTNVDWYIEYYVQSSYNPKYDHPLSSCAFVFNSTTQPKPSKLTTRDENGPSYVLGVDYGLISVTWSTGIDTGKLSKNQWFRSAKLGTTNTLSVNIGVGCGYDWNYDHIFKFRVVAYAYNSVGGCWVTTPEVATTR